MEQSVEDDARALIKLRDRLDKLQADVAFTIGDIDRKLDRLDAAGLIDLANLEELEAFAAPHDGTR